MGKKVLTLDTMEPDRDFIAIDGKSYYLRDHEELSIRELARITRCARVVANKAADSEATEDEMGLVESSVNDTIDLVVLGLPAEIRDKLTGTQKYQVVTAFMTAASLRRARAKAEEDGSPSTSDDSSPGSAASTEVPSTTG